MSCPICDQKPMNCDHTELEITLHEQLRVANDAVYDEITEMEETLLLEKVRVRLLARYLSELANDPSMMDYYLERSTFAAKKLIEMEQFNELI